MYEILFSNLASEKIRILNSQTQQRLLSVLERMHINPMRNIKRVVGDNSYKLYFDSCRVLLDIKGKSIFILTIKEGGKNNE